MGRIKDEAGNAYGRLMVGRFSGLNKNGEALWECKCRCGGFTTVLGASLRNGGTRSCGCLARESASKLASRMGSRRGSERHSWRGGRTVDGGGYVRVMRPDHPNAYEGRYVLEHRLVMEEHLGRLLEAHETVHHKNGITGDNGIENLEPWDSRHPPGQRIRDKLEWAQTLIEEWGGEVTWTERPEFL